MLTNFLRQKLLPVILAIATIGSFAFGIYAFNYEKKPNLKISEINDANVLNIYRNLNDLVIFFQNDDIQKLNQNLKLITLKFENDGNSDILPGYYDNNNVWGLSIPNCRIIEARLLKSNSEYILSNIKPIIINENTLQLNKIIFEKRNYFTIELLVLHNKSNIPLINYIGKIAGIDNIKVFKIDDDKNKTGFLQDILYGNIFIHIIRFLIYILCLIIIGLLIAVIAALISNIQDAFLRNRRNKFLLKHFSSDLLISNKYIKYLSDKYISNGKSYINNINTFIKRERYLLVLSRLLRHYNNKQLEIKIDRSLNINDHHSFKRFNDMRLLKELMDNGMVSIDNNEITVNEIFKRYLLEISDYISKDDKL